MEKIIEGFENYSITKDGVVTNLTTGKVVNGHITSRGYRMIELQKNKNRYRVLLHRLIAIHFIQNPFNRPQINHIDGNKLNNHHSNLEWCTAQENIRHAYDKGLQNGNHMKKMVVDIETGIFYETVTEAANVYGYSQTHTSAMLIGRKRNRTNLRYA